MKQFNPHKGKCMDNLDKWFENNINFAKHMPIADVVKQSLYAGFCMGIKHAISSPTCSVLEVPGLHMRIKASPLYRIYQYQTNCNDNNLNNPLLPKKGEWVVQARKQKEDSNSTWWVNISAPFKTSEEAHEHLNERVLQIANVY